MKKGVEYFNTIAPSADINLLYTGHEQCPPRKQCNGIRSHFLLHYVLSGIGYVGSSEGLSPLSGSRLSGSRDSDSRLSAGDLFCYFPDEPMNYTSDESDPWQYTWVGFQGSRAGDILRRCGFSETRIVCSRPFSAQIAENFSRLILIQAEGQRGFEIVSDGLLLQFLGLLAGEIPRSANGTTFSEKPAGDYNYFTPQHRQPHYYVEAMKQFMQINYQKPISVQQVIDYIGIDRSYASRIFRRAENRTLQRYLIELRVGEAKRLLAQRRFSIHTIAHSVGYTDYPAFERRFKIEVGCSPSEY